MKAEVIIVRRVEVEIEAKLALDEYRPALARAVNLQPGEKIEDVHGIETTQEEKNLLKAHGWRIG